MLGHRVEELVKTEDVWVPGKEIRLLHIFRTVHHLNGGLPMHLHRKKANFVRGRQDVESEEIVRAMLRLLGVLGDPVHEEYAYLLWALQQFRPYQATDKPDHVFAALAFCSPFLRRAGVNPPITASYEMTKKQVFSAMAAELLRSLPFLAVLSLADHQPGRDNGLPSWVPDFGDRFVHKPLIQRGFTPLSLSDLTTPEPIYNASDATWPPESQRPIARIEDGNRIRLWATRLGAIQDIGPATDTSPLNFTYVP